MTMPTNIELEQALNIAGLMRERGRDDAHLAKSLLSCHYLQGYLLEVFHSAEVYLRSGQSEQAHRKLLVAVERARKEISRNAKREGPALGL